MMLVKKSEVKNKLWVLGLASFAAGIQIALAIWNIIFRNNTMGLIYGSTSIIWIICAVRAGINIYKQL